LLCELSKDGCQNVANSVYFIVQKFSYESTYCESNKREEKAKSVYILTIIEWHVLYWFNRQNMCMDIEMLSLSLNTHVQIASGNFGHVSIVQGSTKQ
jgi:hypothetical protein